MVDLKEPDEMNFSRKESDMQTVNKFTQFTVAVMDMLKAKAFYADQIGLNVTKQTL